MVAWCQERVKLAAINTLTHTYNSKKINYTEKCVKWEKKRHQVSSWIIFLTPSHRMRVLLSFLIQSKSIVQSTLPDNVLYTHEIYLNFTPKFILSVSFTQYALIKSCFFTPSTCLRRAFDAISSSDLLLSILSTRWNHSLKKGCVTSRIKSIITAYRPANCYLFKYNPIYFITRIIWSEILNNPKSKSKGYWMITQFRCTNYWKSLKRITWFRPTPLMTA